jgi:hypothetical protein
VITLVQLRLAIPHAALAVADGVFPATVTLAVTPPTTTGPACGAG